MYRVLLNGDKTLFDLKKGFYLINPQLSLEDSTPGQLTFTIDPTHPYYNDIVIMNSEILVLRGSDTIWKGRPIREEIDFYKQKSITCEGVLGFLNDTIQPPRQYPAESTTLYSFLTALLTMHNNQSSKKFYLGAVTVTDPDDSLYRYTNDETTLGCINEKLLDRLGGHLRLRYHSLDSNIVYVDYYEDWIKKSNQKISFGKNLLDYSSNYDLTNIATAVIPLGEQLEESPIEALTAYLDISSVNDGNRALYNRTAVSNFGYICKVVHWDDVTVPQNLKNKGNDWLNNQQYNEMVLEIKAIDFNLVDDDEVPIDLLDEVRVLSQPHGLDLWFPVTKMDIALADPGNTTLTLGKNGVKRSLSAASAEASKDLRNYKYERLTESNILKEAKANATELIIQGVDIGHVRVNKDEILIMDTDDKDSAQKVWRWNLNGLGYSQNGYDGPYGMAMTMDGAIVADFITTGTLNADLLKAGMIRDRYGYNYWNLDTGEFSLSPNTEIGGTSLETYIHNSVETQAEEYVDAQIEIIQKQIDGAIETYYEDYEPKLTNKPASDWTTESDKEKHEGDLFYWREKGYAYRFMKNQNGTWEWMLIKDTDLTQAIATANGAMALAGTKITTYAQNAKPVPSPSGGLSVGDLWIDTKNKNLLYRWNGSSWINVRDQMIVDAQNAASKAQKLANQAKTDIAENRKFVEALEKEFGYNILRGTNNTTTLTSSGAWNFSLWRSASGGTGSRTSVNYAGKGPQENIFRGWRLANPSGTVKKTTDIAQDNVEVTPDVKYTISCYAKGTGKLLFQFGKTRYLSKTFVLNKVNAWTRYKWTFTTTSAASAGKYLVQGGKTNIYFGNRDLGTIEICGMQLELGSELHDYHESSEEGAIKAMKESLTQEEIFNRLTKNGTKKGITLKNQELYINASYINTGTLSANYIKTGVIKAKKGKSYWNMESGIMELYLQRAFVKSGTSEVEVSPKGFRLDSNGALRWKASNSSMSQDGTITCKNAQIDGMIQSGTKASGSYIQIDKGRMFMYYNNTKVGFIGANVSETNSAHKGLVFDLESSGAFMSWSIATGERPGLYETRLMYSSNKRPFGSDANTINAGCNLNMNGHKIYNTGGSSDGSVEIPKSISRDGTVNSWYHCTLKDGILYPR